MNRKTGLVRIVEGFGRAVEDFSQVGAGPPRLQQKIMRPAKRQQTAFDRLLRMLRARRIAQTLRGNGAHRCECVLDAVMKLFQDEFLEFLGRFALLGIDTGLGQQRFGAQLGLRQQQPQTDVLRRQNLLR